MFNVRDELADILRHDIINFDKTRLKVVVRSGFDDSGLDESTGVDIGSLVDQPGGVPVGAVVDVTLMYKDGIVAIITTYGILILGDALSYASSRFANIL